jgi:uncharacterized protein (DUF305 family)
LIEYEIKVNSRIQVKGFQPRFWVINSAQLLTDSDLVFLEEMIPHHKMALMMTAHIVDSDQSELRTMAKNIMQTQTVEIDKMRQFYKTWYR